MAVADDKTRIMTTITLEEKEILKEIAKSQKRPLSNMVSYIITKYIDEHKKIHD